MENKNLHTMEKQSEKSRAEILNKIAVSKKNRKGYNPFSEVDLIAPIYKKIEPDLISCFKKEIESVNGTCVVADTEKDIFEEIKKRVKEPLFCMDKKLQTLLTAYNIPFSSEQKEFYQMETGFMGCECLIARTGSVIVSSVGDSGRRMNVFPPVHFIFATENQIFSYIEEGLSFIQQKYGENLPSQVAVITGPSRTADIEKTLILGAHGPKEICVFILKTKKD